MEKGNFIFQNFRIMSTNTLSKETEKNLIDFFNKSVDPKAIAKLIRQLNYIVALGVMREHETLHNNITTLENSFY